LLGHQFILKIERSITSNPEHVKVFSRAELRRAGASPLPDHEILKGCLFLKIASLSTCSAAFNREGLKVRKAGLPPLLFKPLPGKA
jgi:hypothetical protein